MKTIPDLIEALGGATRIAAYLSEHYEHVHYKSVSQWKLRESIPQPYWMALIEMAKAKKVNGVSYKLLVRMHTPPHLLPLPRIATAS